MRIPRIESTANQRVRSAKQRLKKKESALFLVEGMKLFEEALQAGIEFEEIYARPEFIRSIQEKNPKEADIFEANERVIRSVSELETPPGLVALARRKLQPSEPPAPIHFAALIVSVRDPGNFGAIIRSAEAAGCEFIAYNSDCVDPYNSKVVRASMGSIFRVPLHEVGSAKSYLEQANNVYSCALDPKNGVNLFEWDPHFPCLIVVGSEARGLPADLSPGCRIKIPMNGKVESLNTAVAFALCAYRVVEKSQR